jgi:hypothetical protein
MKPQDEWLGPMTDAVLRLSSNPDVLVRDAGTVFTFCPLSPRAKAWIDEHVQGEVQWFGHALIVERRYAWVLSEGMKDAGLLLDSTCSTEGNGGKA